MTVVPPGASAVPRHVAHSPVRTAELASGGFGELLEERRALTDPQAGPDGSAPLAVSFDQGDLFGTAVALRHDRAPVPSISELRAEGRGGQAATSSEPPPTFAQTADAEDPIQPTAGRERSDPTDFAHLSVVEPEAVGNRRSDAPMPSDAETPWGASTRPAVKSRSIAEAVPVRGRQSRAEAGSARRREAVAQFAPVNVVARATQAGVEIAVRIGHRPGEDEEALENAIRQAVDAEGEALDGLRVDGREIERSRRCR